MRIGLLSLVSDIHDPDKINSASLPLLNALKKEFDITEIKISEISHVDIPIIFIKTGGTENKFIKIAKELKRIKKPITLLTSKSNNSLAAALEILSWANNNGFKDSILMQGAFEDIKKKLEQRIFEYNFVCTLKKTTIGVLGKPSDWLIASEVNYEEIKKRWGVSIIDIEMDEVKSNIKQFSESDTKEIQSIFSDFPFNYNITLNDIAKAATIYLGVKKTILDNELSALTLRCFDLLGSFNTTGCLALAKLNDEGIPAGCEGDIPSIFTMIINQMISGAPSFMANPSNIESKNITLAHCTAPMSMVDTFEFKTHFESGIGVGIAGKFNTEKVTLSKIGGSGLEQYYVDEADFIKNLQSEELCRTQIIIKPKNGIDYFLNSPIGNHHIITDGIYADKFKKIMSLFDVKFMS